MAGRKTATDPFPVRFSRTEAGNFAIWDNGGNPGDRGRPYHHVGEITRHAGVVGTRWTLERTGHAPVDNLPTMAAAKALYLTERNRPIDPAEYLPPEEPPCPTVCVDIGIGEWERLDEWRSRIFRALCQRNSPATITLMLTPTRTDHARRILTLTLPAPVADDLHRWRNRW